MTRIAAAIACAVLVGSTASALAQPSPYAPRIGPYVGASVGATYTAVDVDANQNAAFSSVDRSDAGGKIYLGFRAHRNFGVEVGYADLGEVQARTGNFSGFVEREWRTKGAFVDAVAYFPIVNRWTAFGKMGAVRSEVKVHTSSGGSLVAIPLQSDRKRETNFKFGFGAQFDITPNLAARAEVEVFTGIGDASVGLDNGSIGLYTIGIQFRF